MTATAPNPAAEATQMAHTPDMRPDPPAEAIAAEPAAAGARTRRWAVLGDNPLLTVLATGTAALLTVLGTVAVALLLFILNDHSNRLDRLEDIVANGFAAQDAKIDALDRRLTAKIDEFDAKFDELNLKLTALIAALNMTDEVDAALEGRLLGSESAVTEPGGAPG